MSSKMSPPGNSSFSYYKFLDVEDPSSPLGYYGALNLRLPTHFETEKKNCFKGGVNNLSQLRLTPFAFSPLAR